MLSPRCELTPPPSLSQIIKPDVAEPAKQPYQMTQTEQIAQQAFDRPKHSAHSTSDASFAPASALTAKVPIDFKKLQLFKGRCRAYELRASSPLLRDDALRHLGVCSGAEFKPDY